MEPMGKYSGPETVNLLIYGRIIRTPKGSRLPAQPLGFLPQGYLGIEGWDFRRIAFQRTH